ncbi:MAG: hypothetical protein N2561_04535 [Bacteroidetes bacterium]|nr:hypothetical protein [Rhodothermia bacterium]MCS7154413.1 hypothetical protein [Bacteroidota bacterium]MCX7906786.1 hypothetical protein [Bacteroidota bacterium]MDW8285195.1 hypothetical protein [Bacteroidota bacterium]
MWILVASALAPDHPKMRRAGAAYPPLATLVLASVLRKSGYRVCVFDATPASGPEAFAEALGHSCPDAVVLYDDHLHYASTMCPLRMRDAACRMLEEAARRGLPAFTGSANAADCPEPHWQADA